MIDAIIRLAEVSKVIPPLAVIGFDHDERRETAPVERRCGMKLSRDQIAERNRGIIQEYVDGATCGGLADKYDLSRECVYQILRPAGVIEDKEAARIVRRLVRLEQKIARREVKRELAEKVEALVRAGISWNEAGARTGITLGQLQTIQAKSDVKSNHGRWRDFSERRATIAGLRAQGASWASINTYFGVNVYAWARTNMPELFCSTHSTANTTSQTKETAPSADPTATAVNSIPTADTARSSEVI
jgi:hypothetical protein